MDAEEKRRKGRQQRKTKLDFYLKYIKFTNSPVKMRYTLAILKTEPYSAFHTAQIVGVNRIVLKVGLMGKSAATLGNTESENKKAFDKNIATKNKIIFFIKKQKHKMLF